MASYDVWQDWLQSEVLKAYGDCAARHSATVQAWPGNKQDKPKRWWEVF